MTMRGFGAGVLKESKEQAKVIRNASRFLTGEAREGSIVTNSNDNRKTYNNNVSSTIQVQQMVVRDEQDIRSLAVEIATLTRRQQRGKGLRFTSLLCQRRHAGRLMCLTAIAELFDKAAPEAYATA